MTTLPVVDMRTYTITPRRMGEFIEVFERLAMPVLKETLGYPLGFYTTWVGTQNQFVHLWGYRSLEDYERRSACRDAHPDFAHYLSASAHLIVAQETSLVRGVSSLSAWVDS